jgi:glycogen debranching enzyme
MDGYGDSDGDGYIEYKSASETGLINQGWKDSGDAIVNEEGRLADPPIAMVEVQAYAYAAKLAMARLFEKGGDASRAEALRKQAAELRERFNRDFWSEGIGTYCLALQADKDQADVVSSNAGHVLWSAIATPELARQTADRLMQEDMFSGWGIRTLSTQAKSYNPNAYHLGSVWPHDNAIIAAGFRRYGLNDYALKIFESICNAASYFEHYRLPELFAGQSASTYGIPTRYPVACHPQAWAAGSLPFLVQSALGLKPEGFEKRLRVIEPVLPGFVDRLRLNDVRVATGSVDLAFERTPGGAIATRVLARRGEIDVIVEPHIPAEPEAGPP